LRCRPTMSSIDFRDAKLTRAEAEAIAACVKTCPNLVAINVLRNETMEIEGAKLLSARLSEGGTLRSLCGILPTNNTLEVPRKNLGQVDALIISSEIQASLWKEQLGAADNKNAATSKLVRQTGSGSSVLGQSWHPLIWACKEGNTSLVRTLIDQGLPINENEDAQSNAGFTPLMWAAFKGHAQTVDLLLDMGADPTMENNAGRTAASLAEMKGFKAICDLLIYVSKQLQTNKASFVDLIHRAGLIKHASTNFKAKLIHASDKVRFAEGEEGASTVTNAVTKMQALTRAKSTRKLIVEATTAVEEAVEVEPAKVANLAKQAMLTKIATSRLKAPVMPKARGGGSWGFNAQHEVQKVAAEARQAAETKQAEEAAKAEGGAGEAKGEVASKKEASKEVAAPTVVHSKSSGAVLVSDRAASADKREPSATYVQKIERGRTARAEVSKMKK